MTPWSRNLSLLRRHNDDDNDATSPEKMRRLERLSQQHKTCSVAFNMKATLQEKLSGSRCGKGQ